MSLKIGTKAKMPPSTDSHRQIVVHEISATIR